ncbi:TPA: hypothetical protein IGZ64_004206 [Escherichia coli]|nr:hypothetical protein [Escherichia coli]
MDREATSENLTNNVLLTAWEAEVSLGENKIKNQAYQSSLVGHYTILSKQLSSDGKYTIKLKVNVSDKKGRVALRIPVIFRVNNGAVPVFFNTLTDISGDAIFEFINYNRGNTLVSVTFDQHDIYIPMFLE